MKRIRFEYFGRFGVSSGEHSVRGFPSARVRDLLAILGLQPGVEMSREDLILRIWGGGETPNARNRLSVAIYQARRSLEVLGADSVLETTRFGARLVEAGLSGEVVESAYREMLRLGEQLALGHGRIEAAREVLGLFDGGFAPELLSGWAVAARGRVLRVFEDASLVVSEEALSRGDELASRAVLARLLEVMPGSVRGRLAGGGLAGGGLAGAPTSARDPFYLPVVSACLVDEDSWGAAAGICAAMGLAPGASQGSVIAPNPLAAQEVAARLLKVSPGSRALVCTLIMDPEEPVPSVFRATLRRVPEGEVWYSRVSAALLGETGDNVVFERAGSGTFYRSGGRS